MKIVINRCHGGFSLSDKALALYNKLSGNECMYDRGIPRDDPRLVEVVETLAKEANGRYAALTIVDIPDDVKWQIEEYDGMEWVAEAHRIWQ
jgi:hypothetical protein